MAKSLWRALFGSSFLIILILALIFLYAQSFTPSGIFPENTQKWNNILTGYLVIFAITLTGSIILARDEVRKLATANYWKTFGLRFIPVAIASILMLILLKFLFKGSDSINIFQTITYMSPAVLLVHLVVISQVEELLFGGLVFSYIEKGFGRRNAYIINMILFSLFHFAKAGGSFAVLITYVPLRLGFDYVRNNGFPVLNMIAPRFFGATPDTQQANAGLHFAWNTFVIGFIEPFRI